MAAERSQYISELIEDSIEKVLDEVNAPPSGPAKPLAEIIEDANLEYGAAAEYYEYPGFDLGEIDYRSDFQGDLDFYDRFDQLDTWDDY